MRRRRGQATVIGALALIAILTLTVLISSIVANEQNRYNMLVLQRSRVENARIKESLYLVGDPLNGLITVKNDGNVISRITAIAFLDTSTGEIWVQNYSLALDPYEEVNVTVGPWIYPPIITGVITELGNIFWDDVITGQDVTEECIGLGVCPNNTINLGMLENIALKKYEDAILVIQTGNIGYIALDLESGKTLYQGRKYILPSKNQLMRYVVDTGELYINDTFVGRVRGLRYIGYDYMLFIPGPDPDYIYVYISDGRVIGYIGDWMAYYYNGNYTYILSGTVNSRTWTLYQLNRLNYSVDGIYTLNLDVYPKLDMPRGFRVYDDGLKPTWISIDYTLVYRQWSIIGVRNYVVRLVETSPNVFTPVYDALYYWDKKSTWTTADDEVKAVGITPDPTESSVRAASFPIRISATTPWFLSTNVQRIANYNLRGGGYVNVDGGLQLGSGGSDAVTATAYVRFIDKASGDYWYLEASITGTSGYIRIVSVVGGVSRTLLEIPDTGDATVTLFFDIYASGETGRIMLINSWNGNSYLGSWILPSRYTDFEVEIVIYDGASDAYGYGWVEILALLIGDYTDSYWYRPMVPETLASLLGALGGGYIYKNHGISYVAVTASSSTTPFMPVENASLDLAYPRDFGDGIYPLQFVDVRRMMLHPFDSGIDIWRLGVHTFDVKGILHHPIAIDPTYSSMTVIPYRHFYIMIVEDLSEYRIVIYNYSYP